MSRIQVDDITKGDIKDYAGKYYSQLEHSHEPLSDYSEFNKHANEALKCGVHKDIIDHVRHADQNLKGHFNEIQKQIRCSTPSHTDQNEKLAKECYTRHFVTRPQEDNNHNMV